MPKKNFNNVKDQLAQQAKQRFTPSENEDQADTVEIKQTNNGSEVRKERKQQKTIYLDATMVKLLKKAAYIKDLDQSEIVAIALERYFESEEICLEDGK